MYWTLELASKLEDAPWPAAKEELIDFAIRSGAPLEVIENLQEIEDEGEISESIVNFELDNPSIKAIVVLDLTDVSKGNAIGIGLSDVITKTLYDKIDFSSTYTNAVTSSFIERAKIPIVAGTHKEAFEIALRSCGFLKKGEEKIIRIKDTLHLDEIYVSKSIMDIIDGSDGIESLKENVTLFNGDNDITPY